MELPTNRPDYSKFVEDEETGEVIQVHDREGREIPDPVPTAPPLGYEKPLSMFDIQRAQIRAEHYRLRQMELEQLRETPEQANDFEIDEDIENQPSLYEEKFDPVDFEVRSRLRQAEFAASFKSRVDGLPEEQRKLLDGRNLRRSDERGDEVPSDGDGGSDRKPESKRGKEQTAGVRSSVSEGSGNSESDAG